MTGASGPKDITAAALASFEGTPDPRLRFLLQRLVHHLHAYVADTGLTEREWESAIAFLTATGQTCSPSRQEFILLSDTLGVSMLVDALQHSTHEDATESTVVGPFYVPDAPVRPLGSSTVEQEGSGSPTRVSGTVRSTDGRPIAGAVLDVWQNARNQKYAVQDPGQPAHNLRGRFESDADGRFSFWSVRPTDYPIPDDGPVGGMLRAAGRHPWRPAHLHIRVSAPGYETVTTHLFDDESPYLESDAVFGVKRSLVCRFVPHDPGEAGAGAPEGARETWYTLERDLVLAPVEG